MSPCAKRGVGGIMKERDQDVEIVMKKFQNRDEHPSEWLEEALMEMKLICEKKYKKYVMFEELYDRAIDRNRRNLAEIRRLKEELK